MEVAAQTPCTAKYLLMKYQRGTDTAHAVRLRGPGGAQVLQVQVKGAPDGDLHRIAVQAKESLEAGHPLAAVKATVAAQKEQLRATVLLHRAS